MKKLITRIAACSLAVLIAFNTVAIPKAEAVVAESALVSAFVATYSAAAGFSFRGEPFPGTEQMPAVVRSIETFIEDFAVAREMTRAQFEAEINAGVEFIGDGVVKIGSAAAGLLASFTDWLVDKFSLIGETVGIVPGSFDLPAADTLDIDLSEYPYAYLKDYRDRSDLDFDFILGFTTHAPEPYDSVSGISSLRGQWVVSQEYPWKTVEYLFSLGDSEFNRSSEYTNSVSYPSNFPVYNEKTDVMVWSSTSLIYSDGSVCIEGTGEPYVEDWENPALYATLPSDYEAPPKVDEQYAMVIDTGMTIEDEQDFVDSVLGGMLAGTLAPTYTIEQAAGGDVVVPDEDEETDTQAGILSSVKNIAQNVIALPQTIAEAIKGIFVPDAALTTEITDAFSAKFSFVPTLHRLGTDLLSIGPDSKPPVVYIHLEDAEGAIDYGGTTKALDMSWYQRYKEDGDRIIGGFLWLGFLWLLFKRVPAIINGGEMVQEYTAAIDRGSKRRKH